VFLVGRPFSRQGRFVDESFDLLSDGFHVHLENWLWRDGFV
jgi:hypothetical protein